MLYYVVEQDEINPTNTKEKEKEVGDYKDNK